jgi:hypothetical protein
MALDRMLTTYLRKHYAAPSLIPLPRSSTPNLQAQFRGSVDDFASGKAGSELSEV